MIAAPVTMIQRIWVSLSVLAVCAARPPGYHPSPACRCPATLALEVSSSTKPRVRRRTQRLIELASHAKQNKRDFQQKGTLAQQRGQAVKCLLFNHLLLLPSVTNQMGNVRVLPAFEN